MMIFCSRSICIIISDDNISAAQYFCGNCDAFCQGSLMNRKCKSTAFIWNINMLFHYREHFFTVTWYMKCWIKVVISFKNNSKLRFLSGRVQLKRLKWKNIVIFYLTVFIDNWFAGVGIIHKVVRHFTNPDSLITHLAASLKNKLYWIFYICIYL